MNKAQELNQLASKKGEKEVKSNVVSAYTWCIKRATQEASKGKMDVFVSFYAGDLTNQEEANELKQMLDDDGFDVVHSFGEGRWITYDLSWKK